MKKKYFIKKKLFHKLIVDVKRLIDFDCIFSSSLYDLRVCDLESSFWFPLDIYVENR